MPEYHLTFQFRSNEHPWSGSHIARGIETDEAAINWAQYFVDKIGDDYQITLFRNGVVMPLPESVEAECPHCGTASDAHNLMCKNPADRRQHREN